METKTRKVPTAFRLNSDLVSRLKTLARKENRSLNNYVETILLDAVCKEPNKETSAAIKEAMSGEDLETLDLSNFENDVASL